MIGQTISHYKILEKLGEGGMGVVYKAHDIELDRDVALKFLPNFLTGDARERERFFHEARAASALNHPNVTTIHEIREFEHPAIPGKQLYLAMEYVEGKTFRELVGSGELPLPMNEILDIAIQAGEGLAAAHEKGIIHRDIKSPNLMRTPKGQVKIMDFGLAKVQGATKLTQTGSTIGTAAYMSPEQARGEEVDHRTDIFSFGVVLYELLTGRLPFRGEHPAALMYSIVNEEPQSISQFNRNATPGIEQIVARALAKEKSERYLRVDDILLDLRRERRMLEYGQAGYAIPSGTISQSGTAGTRPGVSRNKRKLLVTAFGGIIIIVSALALLLFFKKPSVAINPDWKHHPLRTPTTDIGIPGLSGDGNWIAFAASGAESTSGLYIMNVKGGEPRLVTSAKNIGYVDVSTDGSLILFSQYNPQTRRNDGYIVYSNGGIPRRIIEGGCFAPRFRPDGLRVGYSLGWSDPSASGKPEFWSVGIDGRDPRREFIDSTSRGLTTFSYSPDGRKVAFSRFFRKGYIEIMVRDLGTGQETQVTSNRKLIEELSWVRNDKIVYTTDKNGIMNVWMIPVEGGDAVQVTNLPDPVLAVKSSLDGQSLLYLQNRYLTNLWIVDITENRSHQVTSDEENQYNPALSPDGNAIAYVAGGPSDWPPIGLRTGPSHLYVVERNGSHRRQLTFNDEVVSWPVWCPDAKRIAYGSRAFSGPADSFRTYVVEVSNPGSPKYVAPGNPAVWLDSSRIQVQAGGIVTVIPLDGTPPTGVYDDSTSAFYVQGGKYILFRDRHQGKDMGVWIVDGMKPRETQRRTAQLLPWNSRNIVVSGDGKTLYSHRGVGELWRMAIPDGKEERMTADFLGVQLFNDFSPGWDGKEMLIVRRRSESKLVMIENLFK